MSSAKLDVYVDASRQRVGVLTYQSQGGRQHSTFAYDEGWIADATSFPIAPNMPFARRVFHTSKQNEPHPVSERMPRPIDYASARGRTATMDDSR